jgi:hypothetical protein
MSRKLWSHLLRRNEMGTHSGWADKLDADVAAARVALAELRATDPKSPQVDNLNHIR